jgi:hypothetical protein
MEPIAKPDAAIPHGHPNITAPNAVCPITGLSHAAHANASPKPAEAKENPGKCPFSSNFVPAEEDDKLPECAQQ